MAEFDRRDFLKLVGAGAGAAAATGCSDIPQKLIPYVVQPEEITPGLPVVYASTCQECQGGCGLHVTTREGRPIKLEGNPENPINQGALCARGQASLYRTYHPDRIQGPLRRGSNGELEPISWDDAIALLAEKVGTRGSQTHLLSGPLGPTLKGVVDDFVSASGAGTTRYEPFTQHALIDASRAVFGVEAAPRFDLTDADYILDFGSDFLEVGSSPVEHTRQFADSRDILRHPNGGATFVYVGPRMSMTASNADQWLAAKPGTEGLLALAIGRVALEKSGARGGGQAELKALLADFSAEKVAQQTGVTAQAIEQLGDDLAHSQRAVALPPGIGSSTRSAVATNAAVLILNSVLGAIGETVVYQSDRVGDGAAQSFDAVAKLSNSLQAGDVDVLLILGSNPVYSLPASLGFEEAMQKAFVVSFASEHDETSHSQHVDLILPDHAGMERWGDEAAVPGIHGVIQPTIRPLYNTRAAGDTLLDTARALKSDAVGPEDFQQRVRAQFGGSESDWREVLARGGVYEQVAAIPVQLSAQGIAGLDFAPPELSGDGAYVLLPNVSPLMYDGSGASIPVLQELPDPVTSIMWQSWVEISREMADSLELVVGDVVSIATPSGTIEVPAYPRGGIRSDVVAVATGQGHTVGLYASRDGKARGVNVMDALPAATDEAGGRAWLTTRAAIQKTGRSERMAQAQGSDNKRGRQLAETVSLSALAAAAHDSHDTQADGHGGGHGGASGSHEIRKAYDATDDSTEDSAYRWGMTIDLDRCSGCAACVAACYYENNIPTVGEEGAQRSRQMSWLRIERYVGDGTKEMLAGRHPGAKNTSHAYTDHEELGEVDIRHSPMLCQQCGAAPCEPVCPVYATYHTPEGLNAMIYNRCIGTRYCSNNCPYKVRRFNWFDYQIESWPEPTRLMLNPDVTVRGQGVMEKCTFCVQRIQSARQVAKDEGRPIADDEVQTACQQTCASQAIQFGNLKDDESKAVQEASKNPVRAYHALHVLNTRPAITYLAKVTRNETDSGAKPGGHH